MVRILIRHTFHDIPSRALAQPRYFSAQKFGIYVETKEGKGEATRHRALSFIGEGRFYANVRNFHWTKGYGTTSQGYILNSRRRIVERYPASFFFFFFFFRKKQ